MVVAQYLKCFKSSFLMEFKMVAHIILLKTTNISHQYLLILKYYIK